MLQEQKNSDGVDAEVELDDNEKGKSSGDEDEDEDEAGRDEVSILCVVVTQRVLSLTYMHVPLISGAGQKTGKAKTQSHGKQPGEVESRSHQETHTRTKEAVPKTPRSTTT